MFTVLKSYYKTIKKKFTFSCMLAKMLLLINLEFEFEFQVHLFICQRLRSKSRVLI